MFQCGLLSLRLAKRLQSDAIYRDYFTCCSRRPVGGADDVSKNRGAQCSSVAFFRFA